MWHGPGTWRVGLSAWVIVVTLILGGGLARAADGDEAKPAKPGQSSAEKEPDTTGELFPGVKGISGDELARRIDDYEKRKQEKEQEKNKSQPAPAPVQKAPNQPKDPPAEPAGQKKQPPAEKAPNQPKDPPADPPKPPLVAGIDLSGLKPLERDFVKNLAERTARIEAFLPKAQQIRTDATTEARKTEVTEEWILYHLRYHLGTVVTVTELVKYRDTLMFPITIYHGIYSLTCEATKFSQKARPPGLAKEADEAVGRLAKRLTEARRKSLLPAAELLTQIRELKTAEQIYSALLKEFPDDQEIKKSYDNFVRIRDEPKPAKEPDKYPKGFVPSPSFW